MSHTIPIMDIVSNVTTGEEFKSHLTDVNADRVAGGGMALVLADGYSLANLTTDVASVATAITTQEDLDNAIATRSVGTRTGWACRSPMRAARSHRHRWRHSS